MKLDYIDLSFVDTSDATMFAIAEAAIIDGILDPHPRFNHNRDEIVTTIEDNVDCELLPDSIDDEMIELHKEAYMAGTELVEEFEEALRNRYDALKPSDYDDDGEELEVNHQFKLDARKAYEKAVDETSDEMRVGITGMVLNEDLIDELIDWCVEGSFKVPHPDNEI